MRRGLPGGIIRSLACSLPLLAFLVGSPGHAGTERITEFTAAVTVNEDSTLAVTETIKVVSTGDQIRRGIIRRFPLTYQGDDGQTYRVDFRVDGALINEWDVPWHKALEGEYALVYLGDPEIVLDPGEYEFSLAYTTTNHIRYSAGHAMLNYNVTGVWDFPIENVETEVILPEMIPPEEIILQCYTGREGSTESDCQPSLIGRTCRFRTTRELEPGEQLTVLVEFPEAALTAAPVTNLADTAFPEREPVAGTQRSDQPYTKTGTTHPSAGTHSSSSADRDSPLWFIVVVAIAVFFGVGKILSLFTRPAQSTVNTSTYTTYTGTEEPPVAPIILQPPSMPVTRSSGGSARTSSSSRSRRRSSTASRTARVSRSHFPSGKSGRGSGGGGGGGW